MGTHPRLGGLLHGGRLLCRLAVDAGLFRAGDDSDGDAPRNHCKGSGQRETKVAPPYSNATAVARALLRPSPPRKWAIGRALRRLDTKRDRNQLRRAANLAVPSSLLRSCTTHGCPNLSAHGPCDVCAAARQQRVDQRRGSAASRGYGSRWAATSTALRRSQLRWCGDRMPGAPVTTDSRCPASGLQRSLSQVVDHIVPVAGPRDPRFWDRANWQGLCDTCHNAKRQRESRQR